MNTENANDPAEAMFDEVMGDYMNEGQPAAEPSANQTVEALEQATQQPAESAPSSTVDPQPASVHQEQAPNTGGQPAPGQQPAVSVLTPHTSTLNAAPEQRLFTDGKGNVVNSQGAIVYAAGKERRMFESNQNAQQHVNTLNTTIASLQHENQQLKAGGNLEHLAGRYQLTPDTMTEALQFRARYDRDPLGTMREMIALTMQAGYTADQLLGGTNGQLDPQAAISAAVSKALTDAGVVHQNQQPPAQDTVPDDYIRVQQAFPVEARLHDAIIAKMFPSMPGDTMFVKASNAVYKLREYAAQHGLDMNSDLMPQLQALEARRTAQPTPGTVNTPPAIPNGNAAVAGAVPTTEASSMAAVEDSFDDIVRNAMRTNGMQV